MPIMTIWDFVFSFVFVYIFAWAWHDGDLKNAANILSTFWIFSSSYNVLARGKFISYELDLWSNIWTELFENRSNQGKGKNELIEKGLISV